MTDRKKLPIGIDIFEKLDRSEFYYIDKTGMIEELLQNRSEVNLFTRPRRFGKSLNMSMLKTFFEIGSNPALFDGLKISENKEICTKYMGQFPVISISLKSVEGLSFQAACGALKTVIGTEALRFSFLEESSALSDADKKLYRQLIEIGTSENGLFVMTTEALVSSLKILSSLLGRHYGRQVILLIDEYDVPLDKAFQYGYYDEMVSLIRSIFGNALKTNPDLYFAVLTGCLRISKESIFTGLNNLKVLTLTDVRFDEYFGFTDAEVRDMLAYYDLSGRYEEVKEWYDGYRFGRTEIFNPWSVVSYFSSECEPRPYWVSTGSNDIIGEILAEADKEIYSRLTSLINGETFTTYIDTGVIYPQIRSNPSTIYSFLLMTGYLKVLKTMTSFSGDIMCEVALPNREIALVYNKEILQRLGNMIPQSTAIAIQEAIFSGDNHRLKTQIQMLLTQSVSSFDTAGENFYHGFMLGLCALMNGAFATSNRESGDGRYDIQLKPIRKGLPRILIELKAEKNCSAEKLKKLSETALKQIEDKKYDTELLSAGVTGIYKYGVAFSGKKVEVTVG